MKCTSQQDFSYAIDSKGRLVNVRYARRDENYTCPCCGEVMFPHMGEINKWHFEHKSGSLCNPETYLHKVAKARLREAFLSSSYFYIAFDPLHECSIDCPLLNDPKCQMHHYISFDLKNYFDICEEEQQIDGFRADLLLRSSRYPSEVILIEFAVSHRCTEEKLASGKRIIEIQIDSEEDIANIEKTKTVRGVSYGSFRFKPESKIVFYNFNKVYTIKPNHEFFHESKYLFWGNKFGESGVERMWCFEDPPIGMIPEDAIVIVSEENTDPLWAYNILQRNGVMIKRCTRCKFYKNTRKHDAICVLYKKYGTPKTPDDYKAMNCRFFRASPTNSEGKDVDDLYPVNVFGARANYFIVKASDLPKFSSEEE